MSSFGVPSDPLLVVLSSCHPRFRHPYTDRTNSLWFFGSTDRFTTTLFVTLYSSLCCPRSNISNPSDNIPETENKTHSILWYPSKTFPLTTVDWKRTFLGHRRHNSYLASTVPVSVLLSNLLETRLAPLSITTETCPTLVSPPRFKTYIKLFVSDFLNDHKPTPYTLPFFFFRWFPL